MSRLLLYTQRHQLPSSLLRNVGDSNTHFRFLEPSPLIMFRFRFFSSTDNVNSSSGSTMSFLINSCGFTSEAALSVSEKVQIKNPERSHLLIDSLKNYGFTTAQISQIFKSNPQLLVAKPDKSVAPKLDYFCSVGLTGPNLTRFISSNPQVLQCSLSRHIIPCCNFFKSLMLHDDLLFIKTLRFSSRIFLTDVQRVLEPNVLALREVGVPQSFIAEGLCNYLHLLSHRVEKLSENTKKLIDMGFDPASKVFLRALSVLCQLRESTWQCKLEAYGKWGWSEDEVLLAFKRQPSCMSLSEKKIMGAMDFLVNEIGIESSYIINCPVLLLFSLKKRIIPRSSVIKVLQLKDILKKDISFNYVLSISNKEFLDKYVVQYQDHVPELLDIFQGKASLHELGFQSEHILGAQLQN